MLYSPRRSPYHPFFGAAKAEKGAARKNQQPGGEDEEQGGPKAPQERPTPKNQQRGGKGREGTPKNQQRGHQKGAARKNQQPGGEDEEQGGPKGPQESQAPRRTSNEGTKIIN